MGLSIPAALSALPPSEETKGCEGKGRRMRGLEVRVFAGAKVSLPPEDLFLSSFNLCSRLAVLNVAQTPLSSLPHGKRRRSKPFERGAPPHFPSSSYPARLQHLNRLLQLSLSCSTTQYHSRIVSPS